MGISRAEQVEVEGVVRPRAESYPAVLLDSKLATSLRRTTTGTQLQQEEKGLNCSHVFLSLSQSTLPSYCFKDSELDLGLVWDSHCHLDFLAKRLEHFYFARIYMISSCIAVCQGFSPHNLN